MAASTGTWFCSSCRCRSPGPVGDGAGRGKSEGAVDAQTQAAAARDSEAIGVMHQRGAGDQRDRLHAGVDQIWVDVRLVRRRADADDAVLGVEDDLSVGDEV